MNYKKWHLQGVDGFVSFLKQTQQVKLDSVEFQLEQIPSIPNNLIFSKLSGKYAACARLTCKSWKSQVDQIIEYLRPNYLNSLQIVAYFSNVETLNLHFCRNVTDAELKNLSLLQNLKKLNLKRCKEITDAGIGYLGNCTNLIFLSVARCNNVGNEGVRSISKNNQNLQYLNIKKLYKLDSGIEDVFENLIELTYLNFSSLEKINNNNLNKLSNLTKLKTLQLEKCPNLSEDIFFGISKLPNLSKFEHSFQFSNDLARIPKGVNSLGFYDLEQIRVLIMRDELQDQNLEFLCDPRILLNCISEVTELKMTFQVAKNFYQFLLNQPICEVQKFLQNLKHVSLFGEFMQFQIDPKLVLQNLTDLTIFGSSSQVFQPERSVTVQALNLILREISTFKNIKIYQYPYFLQPLMDQIPTDNFFKQVFQDVPLTSLANIRSISIDYENFSEMDMIILAKLPNLGALIFENCKFTDSLKNIKDFKNICKLSFWHSEIPSNFVDALVDAFPVLQRLYYLNIQGVKNQQLSQDRRKLLAKTPQGLELLMEHY
eukprot:TRINITY_DN6678_c0_g1_i4.p2 TRINITY_DN6678_c0_g1~~TRINITY_DN6678_c0_g1_i4.p2  ORF type:complete len:543 (-),score=45.15 TRINITY_DN6678_c0_g1_i4:668-2296(-)